MNTYKHYVIARRHGAVTSVRVNGDAGRRWALNRDLKVSAPAIKKVSFESNLGQVRTLSVCRVVGGMAGLFCEETINGKTNNLILDVFDLTDDAIKALDEIEHYYHESSAWKEV